MKTTLSTIIGSALFATGVAVSVVAAPAQAAVFGFDNINTENTDGDHLVSQFKFDVTETQSNQVLFKFINTGEIGNAFISMIQLSGVSNLTGFSVANVNEGNVVNTALGNKTGVTFSQQTGTPNLAQSNNIDDWNGSDIFSFIANKPSSQNGINEGEQLGLLFNGSFTDVINSLTSGDLKIGMHVQGIAGGGSDSFVNYVEPPKPVEVPEPATLLGLGLAFGGMLASRRRQSH